MTDRHTAVEGGPRVERPVTMHLMADWGMANLTRIAGWVAQDVGDRTGDGSRTAIWTGRGGADAARAVIDREVDAALMVPAAFVRMAYDGTGMFARDPHPELRALGTLPQTDRLVLAIGAEHGIASFEDWRSRRTPLRVATSQDDGVNTVGYAVQTMMTLHGIARDELERWGGKYLENERPFPLQAMFRDGDVDALFHEAIMTPGWRDAAEARDVVFIPMEEEPLARVERELGWPRATLPAGYLRGLTEDLTTLDFSDFAFVCREDFPDDVAHLVAWVLGETRSNLERQYAHIPPERSPVTYPLDPVKIGRTAIPLHPGAARYYDQL
jgi:TRAP-type uncharacterized transport system substrate-binding protein